MKKSQPIVVLHSPYCLRFICKCGVGGEYTPGQRVRHCICGRIHKKRSRRAR